MLGKGAIGVNGEMACKFYSGEADTVCTAVKHYRRTPKGDKRDIYLGIVQELNRRRATYAGFYCTSDIFYVDGKRHIDAIYYRCPVQIGDVVAVKEPWYLQGDTCYYKSEQMCTGCKEDGTCLPVGVQKHKTCKLCEYMSGHWAWKSPLSMPPELVKKRLRVASLNIERLHDMTVLQMIAQGFKFVDSTN